MQLDANTTAYFEYESVHPQTLLTCYQHGFFPWYSADEPIRYYNPAYRCILHPTALQIPQRTARYCRHHRYSSSINQQFKSVITHCAQIKRKDQHGTWITPEMIAAYSQLHTMGYAHSFEIYQDAVLCGGLYGVFVRGVFCGESMFSLTPHSSIVALANLCAFGVRHAFRGIDCQIPNRHLLRLGATMIARKKFMKMLNHEAHYRHPILNWKTTIA